MKKVLFFLCLGMFQASGYANEPVSDNAKGTLIVTYQTDSKGERLGRIRFWLKDNLTGKQSLYPKGNSYVDDLSTPSRMVVIENLPEGRYTLRFLIPNTDRYFAIPSDKEVIITGGESVKIDRKIKPFHDERGDEALSTVNKDPPAPKDKIEQPLVQPTPPAPRKGEVVSEHFSPKEMGRLIVSYSFSEIPPGNGEVKVRLTGSDGRTSTHPIPGEDTEIPLKAGKMIMIQKVPEGLYTLDFIIDGRDGAPVVTKKGVRIEPNQTLSVQELLPLTKASVMVEESQEEENIPLLDLEVTSNIPTAVFHLINKNTGQEYEGKGRLHRFENLPPGRYVLNPESTDPFFAPYGSLVIDLTAKHEGSVEALFKTLGRLKIHSNIDSGEVSVTHLGTWENYPKISIRQGLGSVHLPEGDYRLSFQSRDPSRRAPQPLEVKIHSLQTKEVNAYFDGE